MVFSTTTPVGAAHGNEVWLDRDALRHAQRQAGRARTGRSVVMGERGRLVRRLAVAPVQPEHRVAHQPRRDRAHKRRWRLIALPGLVLLLNKYRCGRSRRSHLRR